jgi:hypothetical protein
VGVGEHLLLGLELRCRGAGGHRPEQQLQRFGNYCCQAPNLDANGADAIPVADLAPPPPPPCQGIGTGVEANPDTAQGTCPAGEQNTLRDGSGNFCCAKIPFDGGVNVPAVPGRYLSFFGLLLVGLGFFSLKLRKPPASS